MVQKGVVDDISHEGLRAVLREEGVSFQASKSLKQSNEHYFEAKKNRISSSTTLPTGKSQPRRGDPSVVICYDEFGPPNVQPHPGVPGPSVTAQMRRGAGRVDACEPFVRPHEVRHLLAAYDLSTGKL
jgi:hypothetical protein